VEAPEVDVRGNRAGLHDLQKQFAGRLGNDPGQKRRISLVFRDSSPAFLIRALLRAREALHGLPPGALGDPGVGAGQIGFGNLQIECRLAFRLILRRDDSSGGVFVGGVEASPGASPGIHAVERVSSAASAGQAVAGLHGLGATTTIAQAGPDELGSNGRAFAG